MSLWIFFGICAFFAWPAIAFHLIVFADLVNYMVTGKAYLMRSFDEMRREKSQTHEEWLQEMRRDNPLLFLYTRVVMLASSTSPLGPLAMWCALVLQRLTEEAYETPDPPASVLRLPKRAADIQDLIVEGIVHGGGPSSGNVAFHSPPFRRLPRSQHSMLDQKGSLRRVR